MTDEEVKQYALNIAIPEMERSGLLEDGWQVGFSARARSWHGQCNYTDSQIRLSLPWLRTNLDEDHHILDVVRHEVAHALAGHHAGHGPIWKDWCRRVGATPERCDCRSTAPPARYLAHCHTPGCSNQGKVVKRLQRMPYLAYICQGCSSKVTWTTNPDA